MKYRILIVDDEYYAREGIRRMIERIGGDFIVAGDCADAFSALDFIEQDCPDIVLTDIHMPVLNGIEFVKLVMSGNKQVKFIIITGHDEFEYAKQAFKLDIVDYILKPIEVGEVQETLKRTAAVLTTERRAVKKQLIGYLRGEALEEEKLHLWLPESSCCLALFQLSKNTGNAEYMKVYEWMKQKLTEYTGRNYSALQMHSDRIAGLLQSSLQHAEIFLQEVINEAAKLFDMPVTVAVRQFQVRELQTGYGNVRSLLKDEFYYGKGRIIKRPFEATAILNTEGVTRQLEAVRLAAKGCDKSNVCTKLKSLFDSMRRMKCPADFVLEAAVSLNLFAQQLIAGEQLSLSGIERAYINERLTLEEIEHHVQSVLLKSIIRVHDSLSDSEDSAVKQAIAIINERFCEKLSLEALAGEVFLNPSYLSRKLKEQLGESYIKYITRLRMEKAVTLMAQNANVEQVSKQVGYGNYKRFSDVFKQHTGCLPSTYIKNIHKRDRS